MPHEIVMKRRRRVLIHLDEIEDFVHSPGVESYRNEVAECRTEFFNLCEY